MGSSTVRRTPASSDTPGDAPGLHLPVLLWRRLMLALRAKGGGVRESGAFLLGQRVGALTANTAKGTVETASVTAVAIPGTIQKTTTADTTMAATAILSFIWMLPFGAGRSRAAGADARRRQPGHG